MAESGRLTLGQRRDLPLSKFDSRYTICGAVRRGKTCHNTAGQGTDHYGYGTCKHHGGAMPNHKLAAAKEEAVHVAMQIMGPAVEIEPMDALLLCVKIAAGEVAYATWKIEQLNPDEELISEVSETVREATGEHAESFEEVSKTNMVTLNVWIQARQAATDRLARYSKMALDAGVAERQVLLAEAAGDSLALMIKKILDGLNLSAAQEERAPDLVRGALEELERNQDPYGNQRQLTA